MFADTTYASTIAGAIAPIVTAVGLGLVGWVGHRLSKRLDRHNQVAVESLHKVEKKVTAELQNGIAHRLDTLEAGQRKLFKTQDEIRASIDNLENEPPAHVA